MIYQNPYWTKDVPYKHKHINDMKPMSIFSLQNQKKTVDILFVKKEKEKNPQTDENKKICQMH